MHCNTPQHTATRRNTLQHTATLCNMPNATMWAAHSLIWRFSIYTYTHTHTPYTHVHQHHHTSLFCTRTHALSKTHARTHAHTHTHTHTHTYTRTHAKHLLKSTTVPHTHTHTNAHRRTQHTQTHTHKTTTVSTSLPQCPTAWLFFGWCLPYLMLRKNKQISTRNSESHKLLKKHRHKNSNST